MERLLGSPDDGSHILRSTATQNKYEVEERLQRYYRVPGAPVRVVFTLLDRRLAISRGVVEEDYPAYAGYVLLVSDARPVDEVVTGRKQTRDYVEKVVIEAARAEFETYKRLPDVDLAPLDQYFDPCGSAYRRIQNLVEMQHKKKWTISVPQFNPSTMSVQKVRVRTIDDNVAVVSATEYWYLRWWSLEDDAYSRIYQETAPQRYELIRAGDLWLVRENIYPQPRSSSTQRGRHRR
jgi:hypothetical protein